MTTKTQQKETKPTKKPKHIMELMAEADAPLREAAKLHRDYMRNTKKKLGKISAGIMLRHMDKPKAQKPETLWVELKIAGQKKEPVLFRKIGDEEWWLPICKAELDALRAAQPSRNKICDYCKHEFTEEYPICPNCIAIHQGRAMINSKTEGMAQGTLKTLDELEKRNIELAKRYEKAKGKAKKSITGEEMEMVNNANFIGALRELNAVNYWIAAKRKEAQKQEARKE